MRPAPVYDQADLDEAAQKLAAVDTKSIKKVAEAKWRKKKRAEKKMQQARQREQGIATSSRPIFNPSAPSSPRGTSPRHVHPAFRAVF